MGVAGRATAIWQAHAVGVTLTLLVGLLVVLAITVATGYFVAQEFAYMAVDRSELQARAAAGDRAARRALTITRRTSFMLSGAQLGITVTGLLVGYVAEPLIGASLSTILGGVAIPTGIAFAIGAILALAFSTVVQMILGELFPKNLAIARPLPLARWLARSTVIYLTVFGWLIWIFDTSANLLLRAVRIEPVHDVEHSATARDLEWIVEESRDSGTLSPGLSEMLDRILDFPEQDVEHAMVPRPMADTIAPEATIGQVRRMMSEGHSRYPVLDSTGEEVLGVVHLVDVLATDLPDDAAVTRIQRPALMLPTVMDLQRALAELDRANEELACVIDEYGGFAGILTLEDLAEELIGEIDDEHDEPGSGVAWSMGPGRWMMPGTTPVDEAERAMDIELPEGDYETLSGLLLAHVGRFPTVGEAIDVVLPLDPEDLLQDDDPEPRVLRVRVLEIERRVPARVSLHLLPRTDPARSGSSGTTHAPGGQA